MYKGSDPNICIFELNFKSDYFKNSNTYLTLTVKPYDPIAPELHIVKPSIGNILQSIQSAKVMFQNKKVTFSFKATVLAPHADKFSVPVLHSCSPCFINIEYPVDWMINLS